jgi:signal transduction histidine kinase
VGQVGTDRRLEPVRTTVAPSGRWRLAYPFAVSLAGAGLLLATVPAGVRALLATPGPVAVLGGLALAAALGPSLTAHLPGRRRPPADLAAQVRSERPSRPDLAAQHRGERPSRADLGAQPRGERLSPAHLEPGAMAQPFGLAVLLGWGMAAGVLVTGVATLLAALAWRLPPRRCLFEAARLALATAVAGAAWLLLGGSRGASTTELPALVAAGLAFLLVANALAAAEPALRGGSLGEELRRRARLGTWTSALLLGLAPAIVVVAEHRLPLAPLLLLPVAAVHLATGAAVRAGREHELAERERARAQAAAEAMLATVSHELRAPLTVVLGSLETLTTRDGALGPEQRRELVAMATRQGERLKRLVEQLLEAARLEQAELGPPAEAVIDAVKVAREAERATELGHPGRRVRLDAGRALPVRAAPETLLQVLTNLLDNAAKYSPAGTPIRLQARRRGGQAVIAVIDAGPGIPAGQRERIFERFTQLESSDGRRGEGAGLGLYIARKLARSLGGDLVLCEPSAGAPGARFELRLPLADEGPAQVSEHEPDGDRSPRALAGGAPVTYARRR